MQYLINNSVKKHFLHLWHTKSTTETSKNHSTTGTCAPMHYFINFLQFHALIINSHILSHTVTSYPIVETQHAHKCPKHNYNEIFHCSQVLSVHPPHISKWTNIHSIHLHQIRFLSQKPYRTVEQWDPLPGKHLSRGRKTSRKTVDTRAISYRTPLIKTARTRAIGVFLKRAERLYTELLLDYTVTITLM